MKTTRSPSLDMSVPATSTTVSTRREDIQGLRAIAVIMVVIFHAGLPFPGGFVGVDIFFVISGFVITGMLHREWINEGRIKFGRFYLRRFKRLTPALALMVTITILISTVIMSPFGDLPTTALTGIGAMLLSANFVIAQTTGGYFDAPAESNPLLNTWSLSVEEQFYLVFPLALVFVWQLSRRNGFFRFTPVIAVAGISVLSFSLALAGSTGLVTLRDPFLNNIVFGFYSPLPRAWEFAVGSLLALVLVKQRKRNLSPFLALMLAAIGIVMLFSSLWLITDETPFPGPWTLLPVTGTLLLILAGTDSNNAITRFISQAPLVKVGDWSYSIYLWHWPLIVFAVYMWPFSSYAAVLAAAVSLIPAFLSYRWVEQPLRTLPTSGPRQVFALVTIVMAPPLMLASASGAAARFYWQPKLEAGGLSVIHAGDTNWTDYYMELRNTYYPCANNAIRTNALEWDGIERCWQSKPDPDVEVVLLGDSHAEHLFVGMAEALPNKNVAYYIQDSLPIGGSPEMDTILGGITETPSIETVIVNASWAARGVPTSELSDTLVALTDAGLEVFITDDIPQFPFPAYMCKHGASPFLRIAKCDQPVENHQVNLRKYYPSLQSLVSELPDVGLLNTSRYFCADDSCSMIQDGNLVYRDTDHLNDVGSRYLVQRLIADNSDLRQALQGK